MSNFLDSLRDIKKELLKEQKLKEESSQESKEASLRKEFADFVKDSDILKR